MEEQRSYAGSEVKNADKDKPFSDKDFMKKSIVAVKTKKEKTWLQK